MKLLFEKSVEGRGCSILPPLDVPDCEPKEKGRLLCACRR